IKIPKQPTMEGLPMTTTLFKSPRRQWLSEGRAKRPRRSRLLLEALENRVTPAAGSVRFAIVGDYGTGTQTEQDVANLVHGWNPDFVATTGDNNYGAPPLT